VDQPNPPSSNQPPPREQLASKANHRHEPQPILQSNGAAQARCEQSGTPQHPSAASDDAHAKRRRCEAEGQGTPTTAMTKDERLRLAREKRLHWEASKPNRVRAEHPIPAPFMPGPSDLI
jgi:hypothetical protein